MVERGGYGVLLPPPPPPPPTSAAYSEVGELRSGWGGGGRGGMGILVGKYKEANEKSMITH